MCGISGIISLNGKSAEPFSLRRMSDSIRHRGPDGDGFLFLGEKGFITAFGDDTPENVRCSSTPFAPKEHISNVQGKFIFGFAQRRLAILDLGENGHQPLCDRNKEIWITYNGEIYNYIELRERLQQKGYQFQTRTDTEVIIACYLEWGTGCVNEFNGMWSFVIYDQRKKQFFGSRDRFGVKPFYYYKDSNSFIFASEQKALLKHPDIQSGINSKALGEYFISGQIDYQEQGIFQNILELFPACSFTISLDTGEFKKWTYYTLSINENYADFDPVKLKEYTSHTEELIREAIRIRLRSDVPVGSCLSGGIDSSAIVGIIHDLTKNNSGAKLNTFTSTFKEKAYDESHWAKLVAEQTGALWNTSSPSRQELVRDIEELVYCQDSPIWSTSTYAQFRLMKLVRETGVKVVLDGQGGDELFAGYSPYYSWYLGDMIKKFRFGKTLKAVNAFDVFPRNFVSLGKDFLKLKALHHLPSALQLKITSSYFNDINYLNPDLVEEYKTNLHAKAESFPSSLNGILQKEFINTRLKGYLKCEDRCSMWHSVEARTPFTDDHHLVEYVFNIPGTYKIHNGVNKFLMREAVKKYIPETVRKRSDKMGFATPNNKWITEMREELKPYFTDTLKPYLQLDKLKTDYDSFFDVEGKPENGRIFKFMIFAVWMKVFGMK
jgi:asparagine synthase (glutamine-hydrolysing)